jgi:hypothetical protein
VVTIKSTAITNADATPLVYNSAVIEKGNERTSRAIVAIGNGDSIGPPIASRACVRATR